MKKIALALLSISTLAITACTTTPTPPTTSTELLNKTWILTHIGTIAITTSPNEHNIPSLQLGSDQRFSGADGCNRIMGAYSINKTELKFGETASTMMACINKTPDIAKPYTEALAQVSSYQISNQVLILKDQNNNALLQFTSPVQPR